MTDVAAQPGAQAAAGASGEQQLYAANPTMFRNHPLAFVVSGLLLLGGIAGVPVAFWLLEDPDHTQWAAIGAGAVGAIMALVFLRWWVLTLGTKLTVTSQRTVLRRGLLSKHINEVFHSNVRNVQIKQTFLQRMLSTGTLKVASAGRADVEIEVHGLPHPEKVRELINKHRSS